MTGTVVGWWAKGATMMTHAEAFRLDGEVAMVTGGGTGIGLGIARCLAAAGAKVVLVGRRKEVLEEAAREIGPEASIEQQDVTKLDELPGLVNRVEGRLGPVSILMNNAGIHLKKAAVDHTVEDFQRVLDTHLIAAFALSRVVLPGMIERKHGSILFTASMTSLFGIPYVIAYSAAKSAYVGVVRGLATEVSKHNVRINAIAPGWIESAMLTKALEGDPERKANILSRTPMERFGKPEDIGWAAVYLCSPAGRFITGVTLPVDGGAAVGF